MLALVALLGASCVTEPEALDAPPGCVRDDECNPGQTCQSGACFDGSSAAQFAAELFAPTSRTNMLSRAELEELRIEGNAATVMFVSSVEVTGRIVLPGFSKDKSVAATVVFSRPSRIAGAPDYVVSVQSKAGIPAGEAAFRTRLVPTVGNEVYTVTVFPDDGTILPGTPGQLLPNALAPPTQFTRTIMAGPQTPYLITLDPGLRAVSGQVVDAVGEGLEGVKVRAYNRSSAAAPYELISSTGVTDAYGSYVIYVPLSRSSLFDLRVEPAKGQFWPRLVRTGVALSQTTPATGTAETIIYPAFPAPATYQLKVTGPSSAGGLRPAVGARVSLSSVLASGRDTVTYETDGVVASSGFADVRLIPGVLEANRQYDVVVLPVANSEHGALWNGRLALGPGTGGLASPVVLPARATVTGKINDAAGKAAAGVTVSAVLSPTFLASITPATSLAIKELRLPEVATTQGGNFSMYLDASLMGHEAIYDLEIVPPNGSALPRWSRDAVAVLGGNVNVGTVQLPGAILVSGTVKSEDGHESIADAVVQVYMRENGATARPRATATSDAQGKISLVLPATPPGY